MSVTHPLNGCTHHEETQYRAGLALHGDQGNTHVGFGMERNGNEIDNGIWIASQDSRATSERIEGMSIRPGRPSAVNDHECIATVRDDTTPMAADDTNVSSIKSTHGAETPSGDVGGNSIASFIQNPSVDQTNVAAWMDEFVDLDHHDPIRDTLRSWGN